MEVPPRSRLSSASVALNCNARKKQNVLNSQLLIACSLGEIDDIKAALSAGASLQSRTKDKDTVLHLACGGSKIDRIDIVMFLIGKGANINARNKDHETPLMIASSGNVPALCEILVESGASTSTGTSFSGSHALHFAAAHGNLSLALKLLAYGADPQVQNKSGDTPFDLAARDGNVAIAAVLIELVGDDTRARVRNMCEHKNLDSMLALFQARDARIAIDSIFPEAPLRKIKTALMC